MIEELREVLLSLALHIKEINQEYKLKPAIERFMNSLNSFSDKLVQSGWTINMSMTPAQIVEVSEVIDIDDIDNYFYNFFMGDDQFEFKKLQSECLDMLETRLSKAFEECLFAFKNKKFIICANTLLIILEGVLSNHVANKSKIHMIKLCRKIYESISSEHELNKALWYINLKFIEQLFYNRDFNNGEPSKLNRQWLLHGRSAYNISEIDCLKLMNAINTLCQSFD